MTQLHSWTFIQRNKNLYLYSNLYMNVHSYFIGNSPKVEKPDVFKQVYV